MIRRRPFFLFASLLFANVLPVTAAPSPNASPTPTPQIDPKLFSGMQWRQVGPFRGGRALAIEGVPGEPNTWYFGAVAGGVWKTLDGGANWSPLFDKQDISSIGAIAVAPSDHNTIYVGTGEAAIRGNTTYGTGVYKSVDAGKNWKNMGLRDTRQIGALIIHPNNPDIVLVAALGHAFGPNQERGIFRTSDGGKTWTKVLSKDENTGGIDVVFDPHNPNVVFAALWQARRQPWFFSSGGPGSGLYKSDDNGVTWKQLTGNGLPNGILGRIGITVSGADSNRVYAIIEAKEGGIFRSDDAGEKWTKVNDDGRFRQRAWYFSKIYADPKSADTVYVLNTGALNRWMVPKPSIFFRPVTATITGCGLIRKIRIGSAMPTTAAPAFQWMEARPGRHKTTSQPRSSIMSRPIMHFPITSTVRNRTTRIFALPVEPILA